MGVLVVLIIHGRDEEKGELHQLRRAWLKVFQLGVALCMCVVEEREGERKKRVRGEGERERE